MWANKYHSLFTIFSPFSNEKVTQQQNWPLSWSYSLQLLYSMRKCLLTVGLPMGALWERKCLWLGLTWWFVTVWWRWWWFSATGPLRFSHPPENILWKLDGICENYQMFINTHTHTYIVNFIHSDALYSIRSSWFCSASSTIHELQKTTQFSSLWQCIFQLIHEGLD